jgi:hypothetical protein
MSPCSCAAARNGNASLGALSSLGQLPHNQLPAETRPDALIVIIVFMWLAQIHLFHAL